MVYALNCTTIQQYYVNQSISNRCTDQTDTVTFSFHLGDVLGKLLIWKD